MTQDSENWSILQELFYLAEETDPEDRERVLTERCADAAIVRRALEIFHCSTILHERAPANAPPAELGRVGPYTLIRLLGSGGIGTVYLAERILGGAPQRVALKMLAPHAAGPSFVERFHREQHILGSLDHPHITRMIDAGLTEAGQPFLVMEYVEGEHLDEYCDARKLGIAERLRLFLQVCEAVAYAHRSLIVHLDLKPSNILVTADGTVKLLDFGTSKLIQTDSQLTTTVLATPAYASPEQLRNEPVTTSCDVYSLGAILFEMLSGHRPGAGSSVAVMLERAMAEQPPESLPAAVCAEAAERRATSKVRLSQSLGGDLDTIAGKCLRPRPGDRYASVDLLMQDIDRYCAGRPVLARPQTALYRTSKFIRRNRRLVAVVALSAVLLAAAIGEAEMKQRRAIAEGRRAQQMQNFMYSLFALANSQYLGQPAMSVDEFLNLGVKMLPLYIHDSANLRTAQISLAKSMWENSDEDDAEVVFNQSLRSARRDGDVNAEVLCLAFAGDIGFYHGDLERGKAMTAEALALSGRSGVTPEARIYAKTFYAIGREVNNLRTQENLDLLQQAEQEATAKHLAPHDAARVAAHLASALEHRNSLDEAAAVDRRALDLYRQDPAYKCAAINPQGELGNIDYLRGKWDDSRVQHERVVQLAIHCFGEDSPDALYWTRSLGQDLVWLGRGQEAVRLMEPDVAAERKLDGDHGGPYLARALYVLAGGYLLTGRPAEAEKLVREEMAMATGKLDPASPGFGLMDLLCAEALAAQHRDREALPYAVLAVRSLGPQLASDNQPDRLQRAQAHDLLTQLQSDPSVAGPSPAVSAHP